MGYQLKLQVLDKPKKQLSTLEQKALQMAAQDAGNFLFNTADLSIQQFSKTGRTRKALRKLVFRLKFSAKVYIDLDVAPWAAELMRGNKKPRRIVARGKALKFVARNGDVVFAKSVTKPRTFGKRTFERMRLNQQVVKRLTDIYVSNLQVALTGKPAMINTAGILIA